MKINCTETVEVDGKPWSVGDYISLFVRIEPKFSKSAEWLFAGARLDSCKGQSEPDISPEDLVKLKDALREPSNGYGLNPALTAAIFVRAILDAA